MKLGRILDFNAVYLCIHGKLSNSNNNNTFLPLIKSSDGNFGYNTLQLAEYFFNAMKNSF